MTQRRPNGLELSRLAARAWFLDCRPTGLEKDHCDFARQPSRLQRVVSRRPLSVLNRLQSADFVIESLAKVIHGHVQLIILLQPEPEPRRSAKEPRKS